MIFYVYFRISKKAASISLQIFVIINAFKKRLWNFSLQVIKKFNNDSTFSNFYDFYSMLDTEKAPAYGNLSIYETYLWPRKQDAWTKVASDFW